MASEIGGAQLNLHIGSSGSTPNNDTQFNQISTFFHGFYDNSIFNTTTDQGGFQQNVVTDLGRTFIVFGDQGTGTTANFAGSGDGAVGTGQDTAIKAGNGDNDIIITDNSNHAANLGKGNDFIQNTGTGAVTVKAGAGNDAVVGGAGNDNINGNKGNDFLQGGAGNDTINGGNGADTLVGNAGNDVMSGGKGHDVFLFSNETTGNDTINDFKKGDILQIADRNDDGSINTSGANADVTITQDGKDTVLTFTNGDKITLKNVDSNDLSQDNLNGQFHL
ncbi:Hemolysin-type calcium-binding repeat-containing protein [Methylomagnum ishizawai]|uniref:Hemolysin-type calcium-binding repeat-containing protein n=1 Tax=Methylomagnum ishizawai TaxID=1760988 RepID=A0A1Y6D2F1_9GAMM|nr:calcium-binding protein [Methylomagnum ishizawai]SMF95043.1 Hemolysin-type calcium-binding repeat-containing protein [Methylomagnum ishizawai]